MKNTRYAAYVPVDIPTIKVIIESPRFHVLTINSTKLNDLIIPNV
jgi:hypothetical protein